ncbi:hypothetical protein A7979_11490 [Rothia nasimurium]|uniref:Uncharacterized protein n=1 Tax=Rothia nasimurium TaxID=85336 RepID=A0A1Y1RPZ8_9MICC|nr:hypothetical protein A7979_11490 [Rothia nasimurium]
MLPGPSVGGRQVSGAGGDAVAGAGRGFTRAPETKLVDISSTPTEVQRREVQESLRWTPEQVEAARFDRAGVERYLNDSVMFTGPTPAMRGSGQVWTDPLGNTVRTMDGSGSGRPHDVDRIVFNTFTGGRVPMDPLTWRQAQLPGDFSKELYGMNARSYLNSASHIEFRK